MKEFLLAQIFSCESYIKGSGFICGTQWYIFSTCKALVEEEN